MAVNLKLVQGNIIKPFGRPHAVYLFLKFKNDPAQVRPLLKSILTPVVTSASDQASITQDWKQKGSRTPASSGVGMFGLSAAGYTYLGRSQQYPNHEELGSNRFSAGLKGNNGAYLWDPGVTAWESAYREQDIHAFLMLADDDADRLAKTVQHVQQELLNVASIVAQETAHSIKPTGKDYFVEPFGFREGVAIVPEPESVFTQESKEGGSGCFASFLKLEQDVSKFHADCNNIAADARRLGTNAQSPSVEALAIGRHNDGTPLVPAGPGGLDDFSFQGVSETACPMHAHIRVMNPRNGEPAFKILRRGMPYGGAGSEIRAGSGSGLLFLSFQRSVLDFLGLLIRSRARLDPILMRGAQKAAAAVAAQSPIGGDPAPEQRWAFEANRASILNATSATLQMTYPMTDLTTVRGGEYFYIPSMTFISNLI